MRIWTTDNSPNPPLISLPDVETKVDSHVALYTAAKPIVANILFLLLTQSNHIFGFMM